MTLAQRAGTGEAPPSGALRARLPDGRLHLQHGPVDLVLRADGPPGEVERAYAQAAAAFAGLLEALVAELPLLKRPLGDALPAVSGPVALRMAHAVWPYRDRYITPMAAVAGSVAQHLLEAAVAGRGLARAYVNNGGDIALWLAPEQSLAVGLVARLDAPRVERRVAVTAQCPVRGVATSGWGGRSFSLGIADAVTVFAATAPAADAAATVVANAVTVDHPGIRRAPARTLQPDSDLGDIPVTVGVEMREPDAIAEALDGGAREAARWLRGGTLLGAVLFLAGQSRSVGWVGGVTPDA
jgi:hypothetical protein